MKSVSCRPCAFLHRQKAAYLLAVTSGPLHLSVHHHFSWDPNITHDRRADCYSATTCLAIGISVSLRTWMDPQRMPDASRFYLTLPQMASFAPSQPVSGSGPSVPSPSLSTGWLCDHEGTFQRSSVHVVLLLLPPGPFESSQLFLLSVSPQLKGDICLTGQTSADWQTPPCWRWL